MNIKFYSDLRGDMMVEMHTLLFFLNLYNDDYFSSIAFTLITHMIKILLSQM